MMMHSEENSETLVHELTADNTDQVLIHVQDDLHGEKLCMFSKETGFGHIISG
jgi:hypothetical protein